MKYISVEKYIPVLGQTALFRGVGAEETERMLGCLEAKVKTYGKGEYVFCQGDFLKHITILLEGALYIQQDDYWGNRSIINVVRPGDMFGESYAAPGSGAVLNDVAAVENSVVIFFDIKKLLTVCPSGCPFHSVVIQNLVYALSEKNRNLVRKLGHMSKRTTREKLISYLSEEAKRQNSGTFTIPFNRQQLADFLSVDRSAMSNQLSQMRAQGLLTFEKNRFTLLQENESG